MPQRQIGVTGIAIVVGDLDIWQGIVGTGKTELEKIEDWNMGIDRGL